MSSPAERYAAARRRDADSRSSLGEFQRTLAFELDDFQLRACRALEDGRGVLVAAPTGAGKTVIGEFGVHLALAAGRKAFYTTPIKALSNQKYTELCHIHGADRVGLLTGDITTNGEADVVVMTTEVLRNMMYAGSSTLDRLGYVVMDEVHYLADRFRGAVWEEIIIHLPEHIRLISLSATVSNAEEFGAWLRTVRGPTDIIVEERRPVPLTQHILVGDRLFDLFASTEPHPDENDQRTLSTRINPDLEHLVRSYRVPRDSHARRGRHQQGRRRHAPSGHTGNVSGDAGRRTGWQHRPASRADVIRILHRWDLLPAITFVFSRSGCDAAVRQCLHTGMRLTTEEEAARIRDVAERRTTDIDTADLGVLGYWEWLDGLTRGIAAHHAGLLPIFKEVVEELFVAGLIRCVFATETLALGVNMPARTVVLERLVKWNGETHADITPGEYTQLTGRAGRRGIDIEGHAVVLWHPATDVRSVGGLASTRTYPLRSSFRPTYSMAVNLIAMFGHDHARKVLASSFAQFQADRSVVGLARQLRQHEEALAGYAESMACHRGDFAAYAALRQEIKDVEAAAARDRKTTGRRRGVDVEIQLDRLRGTLRDHPCHDCPDREHHARWSRRWYQLRRQNHALSQRINGRTGSVARTFDRVVTVLTTLGYLTADHQVTAAGTLLRGLYSEHDLLIAQCLRNGTWADLEPSTLAAVVSTLVHETRRDVTPGPPLRGSLATAADFTSRTWAELESIEQEHGITPMREPDVGIAGAVRLWADGKPLDSVLGDAVNGIAAGDFVRRCRQIYDVLGQIATIGDTPKIRRSARSAGDRIRRGVVDPTAGG
ncbi:MAG: DEAD/DEAH box helicase [Actinomycetota bacterium]